MSEATLVRVMNLSGKFWAARCPSRYALAGPQTGQVHLLQAMGSNWFSFGLKNAFDLIGFGQLVGFMLSYLMVHMFH